jgi:hypothetical protein
VVQVPVVLCDLPLDESTPPATGVVPALSASEPVEVHMDATRAPSPVAGHSRSRSPSSPPSPPPRTALRVNGPATAASRPLTNGHAQGTLAARRDMPPLRLFSRDAGDAGPTATTSVFTPGQPHAPQDVDQRPARPVCSSIAGPRTRCRLLARQPKLRDSRRRARRWGSWRPGFSFRGEARHPFFLSSTGVGEETVGPALSTVTEVRGPVAVLILDLRRSSHSGGKKDGGGADPLQEGGRRLRRARRRRREKRRCRRPPLAALRPGGGLARPLPELPPAWMGGRRTGLVDGNRCGGRWRPHPRSAPEARLWWQLVKRRGGSTTGRRSAALDGEEEAGSGGRGTGGAAGLLWLRCGWGAAVRVGNPNRPFLYRYNAGCWARRLGRPVGPPWPTRGLPGLSWQGARTGQRWAARLRRPADRLGPALRRPAF